MPLPDWAKPINEEQTMEPEGLPSWAKPIPQVTPIPETAVSTIQPPVEAARSALGERMGNRMQKTTEMIDRRLEGGTMSDIMQAPGSVALAAGQVAGGVLDAAATSVGSLVSAGTPEPVKKWTKETAKQFLNTDTGKMALGALKAGAEKWNKFSEKNPDAAMALEGIANVWGLGLTKKGAAAVEREAVDIVSDISAVSRKMDAQILDGKMLRIAQKGLPKAIRPTVTGKNTISQFKKFYEDGKNGIEAIIENKQALKLTDDAGNIVEGQLPKNLLQMAEAISQTKRKLFSQYDELARNTKAGVDIMPLVRELRTIKHKDVVARSGLSNVGQYADEIASKLSAASRNGKLSASEVQDIIKFYNSELSTFYKNPQSGGGATSAINAKVAHELRESLDSTIMKATGKEYGALKKQYGALLAIEKPTLNRLSVDVRKDIKGLLDFSDIFSGAQAVNAIAQKNAPLFLSATAAKGIAGYYAKLKDPNRAVRKLFEESDNLWNQKQGFTPKSELFKAGADIKDSLNTLNKAKEFDPRNPYGFKGGNPETVTGIN